MNIRGSIVALITPFHEDGSINFEKLGELLEFHIANSTDGILVLGPFQGKTACVRIPIGKGVCGTAVAEDKVQLVYDVHDFPGHIACDSASNSEIVIPIHAHGEIWGVLDIDSPFVGRFTEEDREGLLQIVAVLERILAA